MCWQHSQALRHWADPGNEILEFDGVRVLKKFAPPGDYSGQMNELLKKNQKSNLLCLFEGAENMIRDVDQLVRSHVWGA